MILKIDGCPNPDYLVIIIRGFMVAFDSLLATESGLSVETTTSKTTYGPPSLVVPDMLNISFIYFTTVRCAFHIDMID